MYEGARAVCPDTVAVLRNAMQPWYPGNHVLFPPRFRRVVLATLLLANRLEKERRDLAVLPHELWLHIISFLRRQDF